MRADMQREARGFFSVSATDALAELDVWILDPASTLISRTVMLGAGTVVYPTVVVDADDRSSIEIGERCVLYPGSVLEARDGGRIAVASDVELGPGGVVLRAGENESLILGEEVRLTGGCELTGVSELGRGAQVLGGISARSVRLGGGRGGYRWGVADERGAVLKGNGIADGVVLDVGQVKSCRASFADAPTERQATYHPEAR
jgi:carbonic anhydrase/acetyltransferase-like protein (isoleucine patch superfamily)